MSEDRPPASDGIPRPDEGGAGGAGGAGWGGGGSGGGEPPRSRRITGAFGAGGWARRQAKLWGFLAFAVLVIYLTRSVILPFVFALLIAYILAPIVGRMSYRKDGTRRMPKGLAILICYLVLIAGILGFVVILAPRLSSDGARIGRELPALYQKLNQDWAPRIGRWLEERFPSLAPVQEETVAPVVADVPLPPETAFVLTPLPDGRHAVQVQPGGLQLRPLADGGFTLVPVSEPPEPERVEDKIRAWAAKLLGSLQSELGDVFRFSRALIFGLARGVFTFFLVLMVAAFILLDLDKLHAFARGLFPAQYRSDYDVIVAGIDRGLSGVIRGQLLICLVNGVLTYVGLLVFDVKYSLILAVVAAILSLIPIFGSILSTVPIVLAALVSGDEGIDLARPIFMVAWIIGIHFIEANFLNPRIIGTSAKMHPVLVIFALIVGEHSFGLVGALLAVPVASIIQVLFLFFRRKAWRTEVSDAHRLPP